MGYNPVEKLFCKQKKFSVEIVMEIQRDHYLNQLIALMWDGQIKVITGIRRCGKSYLLRTLFRNYLRAQGVQDGEILSFELDLARDIRYRHPLILAETVRQEVENRPQRFYLFVDEIQLSDEVENPYNPSGKRITFYDALNDLRSLPNLDIYVTGSNSRMLSSDILTEFRGRSDEIRVHPLAFSEFYAAVGGDKYEAFDTYAFFGGMPFLLSRPDEAAKMAYLQSLCSEVYLKDIVERKKIKREDVLSAVFDLLCSSIGSLTNPAKLTRTLNSKQPNAKESLSQNTIKSYLDHLADAFLFGECKRWDVKGKSYFDYPNKYYCEDIGLRNARIGFRQQELTHIMENILYNELIYRGYSVDIGIVYGPGRDSKGRSVKTAREIDFVATRGTSRVYLQSAYALHDEAKAETECRPFALTQDTFRKIIVRHDIRKRWQDEHGIFHIGLIDFLLDPDVV